MTERAQHVVLFRFPRELTPEEERHMADSVRSWPETIDGFTGLRFGKDLGGRNQGYAYLLWTEFESEDAHQAYYSQPSHVAFGDWIKEQGADIIRVDYPVDATTRFV